MRDPGRKQCPQSFPGLYRSEPLTENVNKTDSMLEQVSAPGDPGTTSSTEKTESREELHRMPRNPWGWKPNRIHYFAMERKKIFRLFSRLVLEFMTDLLTLQPAIRVSFSMVLIVMFGRSNLGSV
jgi:hypothetical protein